MKIGTIFIASKIGVEAYSFFNVAYMLSHVWTFIPLAVGTTLLSKALSIKDEKEKQGSFGLIIIIMVIISIPFILFFKLFPEFIVINTFGEMYLDASNMIFELSLVALLSTIVWLVNRILTYYEGEKFLLKRTVFLSALSIPLNIFMIGRFGIKGVAYSMLILEFFSALLFNVLFRQGLMMKILLSARFRFIKEVW